MARILIGNIKGPQGPQGKQGIQGPIGPAGPQGPLPPLVNNYLTTEAGTAAADAAILPDIDNRIKGINSDLVKDSGEVIPNEINTSNNLKGYYTEPGTNYQYLFIQISATFCTQILILNTIGEESKIAYRIKLNNNAPFGEAAWTWIVDKFPDAQTLLLSYGIGFTKLLKNASESSDLGTDLSDKNYKSGIQTVLRISDGKLRLIKQAADGTETYKDIASL